MAKPVCTESASPGDQAIERLANAVTEANQAQRCCNCAAPISFRQMVVYGICEACWETATEIENTA